MLQEEESLEEHVRLWRLYIFIMRTFVRALAYACVLTCEYVWQAVPEDV